MHPVRIEVAKLILVGTRITYQATGDAGYTVPIKLRKCGATDYRTLCYLIDDTTLPPNEPIIESTSYIFTLETMPARSVQSADIHEANLLQSGTTLFLVRGLVFHDSHSRSNNSLALISITRRHTVKWEGG